MKFWCLSWSIVCFVTVGCAVESESFETLNSLPNNVAPEFDSYDSITVSEIMDSLGIDFEQISFNNGKQYRLWKENSEIEYADPPIITDVYNEYMVTISGNSSIASGFRFFFGAKYTDILIIAHNNLAVLDSIRVNKHVDWAVFRDGSLFITFKDGSLGKIKRNHPKSFENH